MVTATASLAAFLVSRTIALRMHLHVFEFGGVLYAFQVREAREWIVIAAVAVCAGVGAALLIRFTSFLKESLRELFPEKTWARTLIAGALLSLLSLVHTSGRMTGTSILEQVLWAQQSPEEASLLIAVHALAFVAVLSAFGTIGIFWPILALGALLGFELNSLVGRLRRVQRHPLELDLAGRDRVLRLGGPDRRDVALDGDARHAADVGGRGV